MLILMNYFHVYEGSSSKFYSPSARKTSSKELWETRNWFTIANNVQEKEDLVRIYWMHNIYLSHMYLINFDLPSAALSEYRVVKISWMLTSLGKLMWIVFACFVTILASLWIFVWTNCKRESTVSSLSWAKLSYNVEYAQYNNSLDKKERLRHG